MLVRLLGRPTTRQLMEAIVSPNMIGSGHADEMSLTVPKDARLPER